MALYNHFEDGLNRLVGHKGRKDLRGENELIEYTEEQEAELLRCMDDPIYFIRTYVKIVHVDRGFIPFDLYPFQEDMIKTIHENRFTLAKLPRQSGKCVYINTVIRCKHRITGEIYKKTIGRMFESQLPKTIRDDGQEKLRRQRIEISKQGRRRRLRKLRLLRSKSKRPMQPSKKSCGLLGQRLRERISNKSRFAYQGNVRKNTGKQEPSISTRRQIFSLLKEIRGWGYHGTNPEESICKQDSQWNRQNQDRILVKAVKRSHATSTNYVVGCSENLYTGNLYQKIRGRGRISNLERSPRSMAGYVECENGRREARNQSKEIAYRRNLETRKRIVSNSQEGFPRTRSSKNTEGCPPQFSIRYDDGDKNNRIQWRLLARKQFKISGQQPCSSSPDSPTNLGQGQRKNGTSRKPWLSSNDCLGIRVQEETRRHHPQDCQLSETINRKFVASYDLADIDVWSDTGWVPATQIHQTIPYECWILKTTQKELICADDHIVFRSHGEQVFVKDLKVGDLIRTEDGNEEVLNVVNTHVLENMYDLAVDSSDHAYYTNGILSHNTQSVAAYIVWYILFNEEKNVAILANKASTAREIMSRIQKAYEALPKWMMQGVKTWNKGSLELANGSKIFADATSGSGIRGKSISLLFLDEMAHIDSHIATDFFTSTYPTITSGNTTKVIIISTPKGMNLFYEMWMKSVKGLSEYKRVEVSWKDVPGRDQAWYDEQVRNTSQIQVEQEVNCNFLGSGHTLISGDKLRQLENAWIEPIETKEQGHLRIYERPIKGHTYALTVDCATGMGGDAQALNVIDVTEFPFRQVAAFDDNQLYYMQFPTVIFNIARWYNDAFVLIEINDIGQAVSYIMQVEIGYDNLIKIKPKGKQGQGVAGGFTKMVQYGLRQTTATKRIGCNSLKAMIEMDRLIINDWPTVKELMTFVESTDSFAADNSAANAHDDLVMSLVVFGWLTDQQFFKDAAGNNVRSNIERELRTIEDEDFVPFGFLDDGINHTPESAHELLQKNPQSPWSQDKGVSELFDKAP